MNVIKLKVDFTNRHLNLDGVSIVENDYNSTKIVFEFDEEHKNIGTKIFEIAKMDSTEAIFVGEIVNNEVILTGKSGVKDKNGNIKYVDENDNIYWYDKTNNKIYNSEYVEQTEIQIDDLTQVLIDGPIFFDKEGKHHCEVSLYDGDSKLTSAYGSIFIAEERVKIGDKEVEAYLPVFDQLMQEILTAIEQTNTLDLSVTREGETAIITITKKDGTTEVVRISGGGGGGGTSDYTDLTNKPKINDVELSGNKSFEDLGIINFSGNYNDLSNKPTIPSEVTESTVSGWGFTKNTGTYSKPSGGIPKTDLESTVQTSLGKADSAVQPEEGKGLFSGNYNDLSNKPTIPTVPTNVSAFTNDSGYLTPETLPIYTGGVE